MDINVYWHFGMPETMIDFNIYWHFGMLKLILDFKVYWHFRIPELFTVIPFFCFVFPLEELIPVRCGAVNLWKN